MIIMLETPKERIELLKAGITGDRIEQLYIELNNLTIIHGNYYQTMEK